MERGKADAADGCSYTRIRRKTCNTVEDPETKRPILRCEKLEQLIRECPGHSIPSLSIDPSPDSINRKPVVVESKSEQTEEEVPSEDERDHQHVFGGSGGSSSSSGSNNPLARFAEAMEEHLSGEIEGFMKAAEDIANELFGNFKIFRHGDEEGFERHGSPPPAPSSPPRSPRRRRGEEEEQEADFAEFRKGFKEV